MPDTPAAPPVEADEPDESVDAPPPAPGSVGAVVAEPVAEPVPAPPAKRESLRDSLARIPDLDAPDDGEPVGRRIDIPERPVQPSTPDELEAPAPGSRSIAESGLAARAAATAPARPSIPRSPVDADEADEQNGPESIDDRSPRVPSWTGGSAPEPVGSPPVPPAVPDVESPAGVGVETPAGADASIETPAEAEPVVDRGPGPLTVAARKAEPSPEEPVGVLGAEDPVMVFAALPAEPPPNIFTPRSTLVDIDEKHHRTVRPPVPTWRRVLFGLTIAGLVASIPVLGYAGYRVISNSTDGTFTSTVTNPEDPGYEAQVEPTPTAVVIQYDAEHVPIGTTFLSLSTTAGGGGVVFVPIDTEVAKPALGVNRLRAAWDIVKDRPVFARDQLATEVGKLLNVGIQDVIELDDAGWARVVAPVAPLMIDSPEPVLLSTGETIPSGQAALTAEQVGPYLAATKVGESDIARLNRSQAVWEAWLKQIGSSTAANPVPGETTSGVGRFAPALAKGAATYQILPVDRIADGSGRYRIQKEAVVDLVTNLVPSPSGAAPGSRFSVRLLSGVSPGAIPLELTRSIVHMGGMVTVLGNGPRFGTEKTTIVYSDPTKQQIAEVTLEALGGTGKARLDREAPDTVDLTIVLGKDILGDSPSVTTTAPTTTVPGTTEPGFTTTSGGA